MTRRFIYARVSTAHSAANDPRQTIRPREWWEARFIEAGFRKHPLLQTVVPYESLENEGPDIILLLEKLPPAALLAYPPESLWAERDLHMDMLREPGRRADAHLARYELARQYIRRNDIVLDAACGLGYGAAILHDGALAARVVGMDESRFAVDYAMANFVPGRSRLEFRLGDVGDLSSFPDASVDCVVSFETIEHLIEPEAFLSEARRVLTPGGRFICSVPNLWIDETGKDPNPFHHHVFDLARLRELCERHFLTEQIFSQVAGGGLTLTDARRSLREVAEADLEATAAEWWILVAMRDPLDVGDTPYRETMFPGVPSASVNLVAFDRDYRNPWLVRAMVSIGARSRSGAFLERLARRVLEALPPDSPDAGAALCVLGYRMLERGETPDRLDALIGTLSEFIACPPGNAHLERWRISNAFLLGKLLLARGELSRAALAFEHCARHDCLSFSPLLATKTVESAFLAGWIAIQQGDTERARRMWFRGLREAQRAMSGDWSEIVGQAEAPVLFGLREATLVLDAATKCASGLSLLSDAFPERPGDLRISDPLFPFFGDRGSTPVRGFPGSGEGLAGAAVAVVAG